MQKLLRTSKRTHVMVDIDLTVCAMLGMCITACVADFSTFIIGKAASKADRVPVQATCDPDTVLNQLNTVANPTTWTARARNAGGNVDIQCTPARSVLPAFVNPDFNVVASAQCKGLGAYNGGKFLLQAFSWPPGQCTYGKVELVNINIAPVTAIRSNLDGLPVGVHHMELTGVANAAFLEGTGGFEPCVGQRSCMVTIAAQTFPSFTIGRACLAHAVPNALTCSAVTIGSTCKPICAYGYIHVPRANVRCQRWTQLDNFTCVAATTTLTAQCNACDAAAARDMEARVAALGIAELVDAGETLYEAGCLDCLRKSLQAGTNLGARQGVRPTGALQVHIYTTLTAAQVAQVTAAMQGAGYTVDQCWGAGCPDYDGGILYAFFALLALPLILIPVWFLLKWGTAPAYAPLPPPPATLPMMPH